MDLLTVVITLIVIGVLLMLINQYIPMDSKIKQILNIVVVVVVVVWLLQGYGVIGHRQGSSPLVEDVKDVGQDIKNEINKATD